MQIKKISIFLLAGIMGVFIVQNMAIVEIQFLFWSFSLPRALTLFIVLSAGVLIGWLWHSHRQERREP